MIPIDLVTGFLGSGKTTFLKSYAAEMIARGLQIGIVENDYGAINIDRLMLADLDGDACDVEMVIGGDEDCRRRRLKSKLIAMAMCGYDRVLMEPSGVYDTDEFFDLLQEEPLDRFYRAGNVIALVDAGLPEDLTPEEEYLLAAEAACAGLIVLSHADEESGEKAAAALRHLNRALANVKADRQIRESEVLARQEIGLSPEEYERVSSCGYNLTDYVKRPVLQEHAFDSLFFFSPGLSGEALCKAAEEIFSDPSCGRIIRIKGYVPEGEGYSECNLRPGQLKRRSTPYGQDVVIVIGESPDREKIQTVFDKYTA